MEPTSRPIVHRLRQATSTQRVARDYVEFGAARAGHVVVADEQSTGMGRRGRTWLSPVGGFYATFIVLNDPRIAVRAGLAAARAIEALSIPVKLKWPNDLVVDERKLGGILIEAVKSLALVGVGINVEERPLDDAVCLQNFGVAADRSALIDAIYFDLTKREADDVLLAAYRARLATLGQFVRIERGGDLEAFVGTAVDIDSEGRLVLDTATGRVTVAAGDCVHLRIA
jgi:BirA family biotin operon repressor/biotin-[acetyl-CoA-carboxylase] ligase